MKELRIGIIGCGVISHRHMTIWSQIAGVSVVACAEIDPVKLKNWGERYHIPEDSRYSNFRELLARDDLDAIDVCVHNNLHVPISLEVLKAGKNCYCEKPMAGSYADAKLLYDAGRTLGPKLAVQISSVFNYQTRKARSMADSGQLGKLYHSRIVGNRFVGRPGVDGPGLTTDFYSKEIGGHGPIFDIGVYHISQMLYIAGMPEVDSVYGAMYNESHMDMRLLHGRTYDVEMLGLGIVRFTNDMTMDIFESWAFNQEVVGENMIVGTEGGLRILNTDTHGGEIAWRGAGLIGRGPGGPGLNHPELEFIGYNGNEQYSMNLRCHMNEMAEEAADPSMAKWNDNHSHWVAYLRGELTDETRIDTPYIGMQAALVSEGIVLSNELRRSVTREEIEELSVSTAVRHQVTDWGTFDYEL